MISALQQYLLLQGIVFRSFLSVNSEIISSKIVPETLFPQVPDSVRWPSSFLALSGPDSRARSWSRPVMMLTLDGAHAPVRPEPSPCRGERGSGDYEEVKGFRLYLIDRQRIIHLMSWHQIGTADELASSLCTIKQAGLIPEDRVRLCVVADGAAWIETLSSRSFPQLNKFWTTTIAPSIFMRSRRPSMAREHPKPRSGLTPPS